MTENKFKQLFPIFRHRPELVYLDSAATALKPQAVIDAEREYYEQYSANIARGLYPLAETATEQFEAVREKVASFIGARESKEIVFTSGPTASINLAAQLLEQSILCHPERSRGIYLNLRRFPASPAGGLSSSSKSSESLGMTEKDNVVVTEMEHHSNLLPWKELVLRQHATLRIVSLTDEGTLDLDALRESVDEHTKAVSISAVSNVLGTINPVKEITALVKSINPDTLVLVDAAQAIGHQSVDVSGWDADFVAFSAHKCFGPTGVGVLYGKKEILEILSPVTFGGGMVLDSCAAHPTYKDIPYRFEAGTPNIGGVIALGAAIDFIQSIGLDHIRSHEMYLTEYALRYLEGTFGADIRILGPRDPKRRGGIIAFSLEGLHPHDIAHLLGENGICVRAGEHCASPLHRALDLNATTRVSFSIYNDENDIDRLIEELEKIRKIFKNDKLSN